MPRAARRCIAVVLPALALCAAPSAHAQGTDRDCSDFQTQAAAQAYFVSLGGPGADPDRLDGDSDGVACEALPCPCGSGQGAPVPPQPKPTPRQRETIRARIVKVVDGDTIRVRRGSTKAFAVRLIGIDTPETKKPGTGVECGGPQASANLRRLSFSRHRGRAVTLVTDPTQDRKDRYGRLLAYARVDSGKWLQLEQLRAGWAGVYVFETPFQRLASFESVQRIAKTLGRGVWGSCAGDFHRPA